MEEFFALREKVWQSNGGSSRLGRHLGALLRESGFDRVEVSASYNVYGNFGNAEDLGEFHNVGLFFAARYAEHPEFASRAMELGLADHKSMQNFVKSLRSWGEHPDSLFAYSNCEAVGWKK